MYLSNTVCECADLKMKKTWSCGETWTEDCFHKTCANGKIELTPVVCPESRIPSCPRQQATKVSDGCCETWKCDCKFHYCHFFFFSSFPFIFLLHGFVVTLPLIPVSQSALTCLSSKRLVGSLWGSTETWRCFGPNALFSMRTCSEWLAWWWFTDQFNYTATLLFSCLLACWLF